MIKLIIANRTPIDSINNSLLFTFCFIYKCRTDIEKQPFFHKFLQNSNTPLIRNYPINGVLFYKANIIVIYIFSFFYEQ